MNIEDDFLWIAGNAFSEMRLMVEGAITIFEDDTSDLLRLARDTEQYEALNAINDIGTALYEFRRHVKLLQGAHRKEEFRQQDILARDHNAFQTCAVRKSPRFDDLQALRGNDTAQFPTALNRVNFNGFHAFRDGKGTCFTRRTPEQRFHVLSIHHAINRGVAGIICCDLKVSQVATFIEGL